MNWKIILNFLLDTHEKEKISLLLMADFISVNLGKIYDPLVKVAEKIYEHFKCEQEKEQISKKSKNPTFPPREQCPFCEVFVPFSSESHEICSNGHKLGNF